MNRFFCIFILMSFLAINKPLQAQDAMAITRQMISTVKTFKTLQYSFDSKERIGNKTVHEVSDFKINVQPFKVYLYQKAPKNGVEVLYVHGANDNKAKVNPNAFPWVNVNLDPEGSLMMKDHHHSIFDGGFAYTNSIIEYLLNKYESQNSKLVVNNGMVKIQGVECYHFTFNNPGYKLVNYTVTGDNETVLTIAKKLRINYYSIFDNNKDIDDLDEIDKNTKLLVPNDYASKMELYIHKTLMYPVYLKIYDNKGLFEEYTFTNVIINPAFPANTFSEENPKYGF